jgi:hypothetical protein
MLARPAAVSLSLALLIAVYAPAGVIYDAAAQFDTVSNPASANGWSYGYTPTLGGAFQLLGVPFANANWIGWLDSTLAPGAGILKNNRGQDWNPTPGGDALVP